jgi:hypothetical protein
VDDLNNDGATDLVDIELLLRNDANALSLLNGNGDFRSQECIELLKESDIVVTNPPFSLFREYVTQLIEHKKDFIIIGNVNAITYKNIFQLIQDNKLWLGNTHRNRGLGMFFDIPDSVNTDNATRIKDGKIFIGGAVWFTTLDTPINRQEMTFYKTYKGSEYEYPKYDNYDAIEVSKSKYIPDDYFGVMGVPITFLNSGYNYQQFEIIGLSRYIKTKGMSKEFVDSYYKSGQTGQISEGHPDLCFYDKDRKPVVPYMRIIIKRRDINEN